MSLYDSFTPLIRPESIAFINLHWYGIWHYRQASSYIPLISKIIFVDLDVDVEDVKDILIVKSQQINAVQCQFL